MRSWDVISEKVAPHGGVRLREVGRSLYYCFVVVRGGYHMLLDLDAVRVNTALGNTPPASPDDSHWLTRLQSA